MVGIIAPIPCKYPRITPNNPDSKMAGAIAAIARYPRYSNINVCAINSEKKNTNNVIKALNNMVKTKAL